MADAFVSYSRRDQEFVSRLFAALEDRDRDVWVDWDDIPPTADWLAQIRTGIEEANALIFVISPDSVASEVCVTELGVAEELNKRIVPLLLRAADGAPVPEAVARHNWIFFDDPERFETGVETLIEALDTDLEHVNAHTRLLIAAQRWDREDRNRSLLIRGTELAAAEAWLDTASTEDKQPAPLPLQAEFVRASREATARRQRITVGAVSVALVVAIALAIVALIQRSNAIEQRQAAVSRELDAQAQNQYDTDPELSVLLATEAAETDPGDATEEALRQALGRSQVVATYHSPSGQPSAALFAPHGDALLIADGDDTARIRTPGRPGEIELEAPGLNGQIAWSGDGAAVATGGAEATVWDARSGERIVSLPARFGAFQVALDRHATKVVTIDAVGDGHVFSVPKGRELASFHSPRRGLPGCFDLSADASLVAVCAQGQLRARIHLWDPATGDLVRTIPFGGSVNEVDLSPDGHLVAIASSGTGGETRSGEEVRVRGRVAVLRADGEPVFSRVTDASAVALSPFRQNRFAFASLLPSAANFVRASAGKEQPLVGHTDTIVGLDLALGDSRLVTGSVDKTARVWDTAGEPLELLAGHRDELNSVNYNRSGTLVATTSADGDTRVWATDKPRPQLSVSHPTGAPAAILAEPGDGDRLLVAGPGRTARILDPRTLEPEAAVPLPEGETVRGGRWAADGSLFVIATADEQGALASVIAADPAEPGATTLIRPDTGLGAAAPAAGGRVLTISADGELEAWDGLTGESVRAYDVDASQGALAVSEAGDRVAILAPDGEITVLDVEGGDVVSTIDGPAPQPQTGGIAVAPGVVFDPSGRRLATYSADPSVRLWDLDSGELERTLKGGESYFGSVAFSPDGELLAGGDANGVYVWNADSGAIVHHLQHADPGTFGTTLLPGLGVGVGFSPDGEAVLSANVARFSIWSAETGQRLFLNPFASVGDVSEDGRTVYTGNASELGAYACDLCGDLDDLLAHARDSVTRELTKTERERFLHE